MAYFCRDICHWLNRWAKGKRDESLRRLRQRLSALPLTEACLQVLACVESSYEADIVEIVPLLLEEIYEWHRRVPNQTHRQVWIALRRFIHRRLRHYNVRVNEAALSAVYAAFCYGSADKRRLFLRRILHSEEAIWITIVDWVEYVAVDDLLHLLQQRTPWHNGKAWNVMFALDFLIYDMDDVRRRKLLERLREVLRYVDELCVAGGVDEMALWKVCETIGFHIGGAESAKLLREVARTSRSKAVKKACMSELRD